MLEREQLLIIGKWLLSYNEPAKTVPILGWVGGCFIKPHLRKNNVKYPHLFLDGEAGSGKSTTLEQIILIIFSRLKSIASSQITPFSLMMESNSSNIVPQSFDEFKPSKLDRLRLNALQNHFRDNYDGHEGLRGRADQTTVAYELLAPIVVTGEESADETAIRERTIEVLFSKKDLLSAEHLESATRLMDRGDLLGSFGRSLLDTALQTMPSEVKVWFEEGRKLFAGDLPTRVISNLACVHAGLCLVEKLCGAMGLSWNEVYPLDRDACARWIGYAAREYLLDGGNHNKSVVEQTFEVLARMRLKVDQDFTFETAGRHLCLCLYGVYDRYTRYRKDYAVVGEVLPYTQFRKQLEHSEYFVAKNKVKRFGDITKKVWVIDFEKLQRVCDVSGFLSCDVSEQE